MFDFCFTLGRIILVLKIIHFILFQSETKLNNYKNKLKQNKKKQYYNKKQNY